MKYFILLVFTFCNFYSFASNDPTGIEDPLEITFIQQQRQWDLELQQVLRDGDAWQSFKETHDGWQVYFNEDTQKPHRAYGKAIPVMGSTPEEKALNFISNELAVFGISVDDLELSNLKKSDKYTYVNFRQMENGMEVINSRLTIKIHNNGVVLFGTDIYADLNFSENSYLPEEMLISIAEENMIQEIDETIVDPIFKILPIYTAEGFETHIVQRMVVYTHNDNNVPANYETFIDVQTGEILYRSNLVMHYASCDKCKKPKEPKKKVLTMGMPIINGSLTADVYPKNTIEGTEVLAMPYAEVSIAGDEFYTDVNGNFTTTMTGPMNGTFRLEGLYVDIETNGNTPQFTLELDEGSNEVNFDGEANLKELSAFRSTNLIHDHMKIFLPDFTAMDDPMLVKIDVEGECNAFYDGNLNFYDTGGGCTATSLIADVVYHEYGHGINGQYYNSEGFNFNNGAMNEGYADFWAISLSQDPNFSQDFFSGSTNGLRRYDIDPKVYPDDLIGQVHNDGEIICGAWYDTHVQMGEDWELTMEIFIEAYAGFQATGFNGNEGEIYVDVLLDALQADDDNGDITDGTPNDIAIIEGFDIHGISLLASIDFIHENLLATAADESIILEAEIDVEFPASIYFNGAKAFYVINAGNIWQEADMVNVGGDNWEAEIPAQEAGTLIKYYIALIDNSGAETNFKPTGVLWDDPTLPYFTLVGMEPALVEDIDFSSELGDWEYGISGDNATAGIWQWAIPIGSFGTNGDLSTAVAAYEDHTDGGEYAFVTGVSSSADASIYDNDVDDGWTTLRSDLIDLTEYEDPIISYWRWVANTSTENVAWTVEISDDGGTTWTTLENTVTEDRDWRRNAVRISDHIEINEQFKIQFIASDPIFEGSGALVEAAVDDIVVWEMEAEPDISVNELTNSNFEVFPNPAIDVLNVQSSKYMINEIQVFDSNGRIVLDEIGLQTNSFVLDVSSFAVGVYTIKVKMDGEVSTMTFTK